MRARTPVAACAPAIEPVEDRGVTHPQPHDPEAATRAPLRVAGLPQTELVDAQGRMVATERVPFRSYAQLTDAVRRHLEVTP